MKKINYFLGFFVLLDLILFSQNEDTIQFQTLRNYFLNNQVFDTTENDCCVVKRCFFKLSCSFSNTSNVR